MVCTVRLLFLNSFLVPPVEVRVPGCGPVRVGSRSDGLARAGELGTRIAGQYEVACLAEVFRPSEEEAILDGWQSGPTPTVVRGPDPQTRWTLHSSGLCTIVDGPELVRSQTHRYRTTGSRLLDADAHADKGVLGVEVDVGLGGHLELYSTHLFYGGFTQRLPPRSAAARHTIRMAQTDELAAFVRSTHRPGNLAVVVGDLNVDAGNPARHADLCDRLTPLGLEDLWVRAGSGPGATLDLMRYPHRAGRSDPDDPEFLRDADIPPAPGERVDYAFVQRPDSAHAVRLVDARMRRRPFPRDPGAPGADTLGFLSDHVGLHVELDLEAAAR